MELGLKVLLFLHANIMQNQRVATYRYKL